MFVCQPCLTINSLIGATFTWDYFQEVLIFFAVSLLIQVLFMAVFYALFKGRGNSDIKYRIGIIATSFGNVGFMGVPLIEAIMPGNDEAILLSVMFLIGLNILSWTVGSAIITNDRKYISLKKAFINPAIVGLVIGLPIFFTNSGQYIPEVIRDMISLVGRMSVPMCMIILGMRLASAKPRDLLLDPFKYLIIAIKQIAMPLVALAIIWFMPLELFVKQTMFILAAAPIASTVLNFAEMLDEGQETAANMVLLSTITSAISIPLLALSMSSFMFI